MSDEDRRVDAEGIEDRDVVRCAGRQVVAGRRLARGEISAAGDADDVKEVGELERELIVHVDVVAEPREQHHRCARTAPVDHLELDPGCNRDEAYRVRRGVHAHRRLALRCAYDHRRPAHQQRERAEHGGP
jgi:hypothetical protein